MSFTWSPVAVSTWLAKGDRLPYSAASMPRRADPLRYAIMGGIVGLVIGAMRFEPSNLARDIGFLSGAYSHVHCSVSRLPTTEIDVEGATPAQFVALEGCNLASNRAFG